MSLSTAIVIPVYKKSLSKDEVRSLNQCLTILKDFPVCFVCSFSFDINNYADLLRNKTYSIHRFSDRYFNSMDDYSVLMLTVKFYKAFIDYDYILMYQLDAWVFKNELEYWCNKGFSYIGAPWLEGYSNAKPDSPFIAVGNGGFSLRHVKSHIAVLRTFNYRVMPLQYARELFKKPTIKAFRKFLRNLRFFCNPFFRYQTYPNEKYPIHEDKFFGRIAGRVFPFFKVADPATAIRFAVEAVPSAFVNDSNIPFGCHKWMYYEPDFWKPYLNRQWA